MQRFVLTAACVVAVSIGSVAAQQATGSKPQPPAKSSASPAPARTGQAIFREYCASCHGPSARGNGPAAASFLKRPPDLTHIAARHKGFPRKAVEEMILGESELHPSHGSREMPVWGPTFRQAPDAKTLVQSLLGYLESIQEK